MIEDSAADGAVTTSKSAPKPTLYSNVDEKELQAAASKYLANYGTKFEKDIITGSKGLYVYTANGHRVLDWTSGQMSCLVGHGHPEIVRTIHDHAENLDHLFSGMLSPPVINLAKRLNSVLPEGLDKAFFPSTGGESVEAGIKV
jgi:adenosylmethionine-8-amino-7-oxononanoate aminotransferase